MSDAPRPVGRPPDPDTLSKARHYLELNSTYGVPVRTIAEREGLTASRIWDMLKAAREQVAAGPASDGLAEHGPAEPGGQARPAPAPRKMSEGALLRRVWFAMHLNGRLRAASPAVRLLWMEVVMAVREEGDGCCLLFAETGYEDHADFATAFGGSEADLALLLRRRLLVAIEAADGVGGISLPVGLGLMRRERIGGPVPGLSRPDPRQARMLQVLPGGRSDSSEVPSGLKLNTLFDSSQFGNSLESRGRAAVADADAISKIDQSSSISISPGTLPRADSSERGNSLESDSSQFGNSLESRRGHSLESDSSQFGRSPAQPLVALAAELAALARLDRAPNARELGQVQGWLDAGLAAETMRAVIANRMSRGKGVKPESLVYFDKGMREALKAGSPPRSAVAASSPAVPLSDAEKVLRDLLRASRDAWLKDRSCPFPPDPNSFSAAFASEQTELLAYYWLEVWDSWDKTGRRSDLKPPDFTLLARDPAGFEKRLRELDEEFAGPETADPGPPDTGPPAPGRQDTG